MHVVYFVLIVQATVLSIRDDDVIVGSEGLDGGEGKLGRDERYPGGAL